MRTYPVSAGARVSSCPRSAEPPGPATATPPPAVRASQTVSAGRISASPPRAAIRTEPPPPMATWAAPTTIPIATSGPPGTGAVTPAAPRGAGAAASGACTGSGPGVSVRMQATTTAAAAAAHQRRAVSPSLATIVAEPELDPEVRAPEKGDHPLQFVLRRARDPELIALDRNLDLPESPVPDRALDRLCRLRRNALGEGGEHPHRLAGGRLGLADLQVLERHAPLHQAA